MSAQHGLSGSQAGFSWRPGDRSTTRTRVTVEKVLTTDPLSVIAFQHVRGLLAECVRQDVSMDAEVTVEFSVPRPDPNTRCALPSRYPPRNSQHLAGKQQLTPPNRS